MNESLKSSMKKTNLSFWSITLFALAAFTNAQQATASAQTPVVKTFQLDSKLMARQMPYNVVFPPAYETDRNARFPVLYLLHGLNGNYKNWTGRSSELLEYSAKYRMIIVNPEGAGGFYTDSATKPNDKYESYIIQELIPEIDKTLRTVADRKARAIAGMSMGGYGAVKFGVKYPDKFIFAASMSGAFHAASWRKAEELTQPSSIKNIILSVYGEKNTETLEANDLFKIFNESSAEKNAGLPFFYFDCGTEDNFIRYNQELAQILFKRKIPHEFRQLPGKHDWEYWNNQLPEVLQLTDRIFTTQRAGTPRK